MTGSKARIVQRFTHFVALGDSIISDDYPGPNLGSAALLYRNDSHFFPEFEGRDLRTLYPSMRFENRSVTGSRLSDVLKVVDSLKSESRPTLAVLSVGGNDLLQGFAEGQPIAFILEGVSTGLDLLLKRLRSAFGKLTLRLLNTYDPTDGTGQFQSGRIIPHGPQALAGLNAILAEKAGTDLVDIHQHFLGHGLRHRDPAYEHYSAEDPSGWFKMDIEPNNRGAHEVRRCLWHSLEDRST